MIDQKEYESRKEYLVRVLHWAAVKTPVGDQLVQYDGVTANIACLTQDICDELDLDPDEFCN